MSCNGCRVLRKGCSETCILRPCLQWIESPQAQGHATVFVAKFFGRAGLMSFISAVPENQQPALFQSLLFEAAGRTVNPVSGAVGLLWTGNWHVCQAAVETVLRGGVLKPIPDLVGGRSPDLHDSSDCTEMFRTYDSASPRHKRRRSPDEPPARVPQLADLGLSLMPGYLGKKSDGRPNPDDSRRLGSPSMNSEESLTTTCGDLPAEEIKLLNLFS
ncbi:LOB domain-containing protein 38 [Striga hermonthica]|uniref:LOB domain-containing protein 38 n=1 Tax=Striga hermonthica TaxID=68872 RepID=A0A9N7P0Q6_STRHE|nr:LOB domain-containing protein 38 [Striga hermonthica]